MRMCAIQFPAALTELTAAWQDVGQTPMLAFDGGPVLVTVSFYISNSTGADLHVYDGCVIGTNALPGLWGGIWIPSGQTVVHNMTTILRIAPGEYRIIARARGGAAVGDTLAQESCHLQVLGLNETERDPRLFVIPT